MSRKLNKVSMAAVAATAAFALFTADGSGAAAQAKDPQIVTHEVAQTADQTIIVSTSEAPEDSANDAAGAADATVSTSLDELVSSHAADVSASRELNCLAGAIYFEAKSEPLVGQLAVGRVIVARARSGRFPNSYCGVVYQPSQFSFVRGSAMPSVDRNSRGWKNAAAIAQIANDGSWRSPVEGALYFHATRVSPRWRMARLAQIGNHVFYR
jgi:spore germination cell wall hydrolase CwlJ-like protein